MRIVDLSLPITGHWRWKAEVEKVRRFEDGEPFQVTRVAMLVHAFTHLDAPQHVVPGGTSVDQVDLARCCGDAAVVDLGRVEADRAIGPGDLERAGRHVRPGDIALLASGWPSTCDVGSEDFWQKAPYLTREAALWLRERGVRAVGFDFPQDYVTRLYRFTGRAARPIPIEESYTHDLLLRAGILHIEYLVNLDRLGRERVQFYALPLKIAGADGSPVRAIAVLD